MNNTIKSAHCLRKPAVLCVDIIDVKQRKWYLLVQDIPFKFQSFDHSKYRIISTPEYLIYQRSRVKVYIVGDN